jgi:hypothetical protein
VQDLWQLDLQEMPGSREGTQGRHKGLLLLEMRSVVLESYGRNQILQQGLED